MRLWAKKIAVILAIGYILFFYSERVFWSFLRPGDKLLDLVLGWLVYSLLGWVFLLLVRWGRVASFSGVFVAGAVFGWLAEGVVVDTLYGNSDNPFPASISFTGLAWHALISVGIGWYAQAKVLAQGKPRRVALFAVAVGLGWGLWAGWWPTELGWASTSLLAFSAHSLVCSIPLVLSWVILSLAQADWFRPAKPEMLILAGLAALFFVGVRVPATPRAGLILPPLILLCVYGLYRNNRRGQQPDVLEMTVGQIQPSSCLWLLLMPISAIVAYAPVTLFARPFPTNWLLYVVSMPLGFLCFLRSLWILVRSDSRRRCR
jgi:hypothetical protein